MRPDEVKANARRIAAHLNPDGNFSDQDRARKRSFRMGPQGVDRMRSGSFCVTPEVGVYLETIFAKLAAPGMCNPEDATPTVGGVPDPDAVRRDGRTPAQRCHDALATLCRDALASDRLGSHRGLPVTIIATATVRDLQQHRKSPPVLVRRGLALCRAEPALRSRAIVMGFQPMSMRRARAAVASLTG